MTGKTRKPIEYIKEDIGRPTKFTPQRCSAIVDAISNRIPYQFAAEANGICEDTLYEWLKIGRNHIRDGIESDYAVFSESIKKAEMNKMRHHLDIISTRPERWQADAWILERRWHKHFGPNAQLNELNNRLAKLENGESSNEENNEKGS